MSGFELAAILITVTALLGYFNERWLHLPAVIGVTLGGLLLSLVLLLLSGLHVPHAGTAFATSLLREIDFDRLVMEGLLSFLLFAGALEVDWNELRRHGGSVLLLATAGVLISTVVVGTGLWLVLRALGISLFPYPYALVFGALISPTDPIAVLAILRRAHTPPELEVVISGESLFNDGVGVVVFTVVLGVALGREVASAGDVVWLFAREALGGVTFGAALGLLAFVMLRRVDNYAVEILITLAVVTGGYALADHLHVSGPLAMVVAGLLVGNQGRAFAMSENTRDHLDTFWVVVDEILNSVLFVLIGLEMLVLEIGSGFVVAAVVAVPLVLAARWVSVALPISVLRPRGASRWNTVRIMTWGGLRGGIAIALALAVPPSGERDLILFVTYVVVVFSILVQGLTVGPMTRRLLGRAAGVGEEAGVAV